jgi:hypothetical protein
MLWLLIIGGIVLIIVGACQKEPDGEQAQRISKIGSTMVKVGVAIVIGIIVIYILIFAGVLAMVFNL